MISMIKVMSDRVVDKTTIEGLGLKYSKVDRVGTMNKGGKKIESLGNYDYYYDELEKEIIQDDNGSSTKWYLIKDDETKKYISSYSIYYKMDNDIEYVKLSDEPQMVDLLKFAPKATHVEYKVVKSIQPKDSSVEGIQAILLETQNKISKFQKQIESLSNNNDKFNNTFNDKINVHTGGGLLVTYNEVMLLENSCTDALQVELNNGWRIVAVSIQNDQRRPDYILGRYNSDLEVTNNSKAKR